MHHYDDYIDYDYHDDYLLSASPRIIICVSMVMIIICYIRCWTWAWRRFSLILFTWETCGACSWLSSHPPPLSPLEKISNILRCLWLPCRKVIMTPPFIPFLPPPGLARTLSQNSDRSAKNWKINWSCSLVKYSIGEAFSFQKSILLYHWSPDDTRLRFDLHNTLIKILEKIAMKKTTSSKFLIATTTF